MLKLKKNNSGAKRLTPGFHKMQGVCLAKDPVASREELYSIELLIYLVTGCYLKLITNLYFFPSVLLPLLEGETHRSHVRHATAAAN